MIHLQRIAIIATIVAGSAIANSASAIEAGYMWPLRRAEAYNWHGSYAHSQYGAPVALVVPPTATLQTNWGWGVGSSRISRIDHQFGRNYSGPGPFGAGFRNTPRWPQDTTQTGVYYVRGPW